MIESKKKLDMRISFYYSVMVTPENHYGLEAKQKLLETLQQEIPVYEAKFAPLHEQFTLLEKYEKPVPDSVKAFISIELRPIFC